MSYGNVSGMTFAERDLRPAHFIFQVDSYSKLFDEFDGGFESSVFTAGDYDWRLIFYPNGNKKNDARGYISLYLAIDDSKSPSNKNWTIPVNFKFFVHDQNKNKYLEIQEAEGKVRQFSSENKKCGFDRLLSLETFRLPLNGYLVNDSCTFGAEVFVIELSDNNETLSMVNCKPSESIQPWEIKNFKEVELVKGRCSQEEPFRLGEREWKLEIYPFGHGDGEGRFLSLYLRMKDSPQESRKMYVKFMLRVKNPSKKKIVKKQLAHWFSNDEPRHGCYDLLLLSELQETGSGYLRDGTLTVEVEFLVVSKVTN